MQEWHHLDHHATVASLEGTSTERDDQLRDNTTDKEHRDTIRTEILEWSHVQRKDDHTYQHISSNSNKVQPLIFNDWGQEPSIHALHSWVCHRTSSIFLF